MGGHLLELQVLLGAELKPAPVWRGAGAEGRA